MSVPYCSPCPCSACMEQCDDYLLLLDELFEAETTITELRHQIECLQEALDESSIE